MTSSQPPTSNSAVAALNSSPLIESFMKSKLWPRFRCRLCWRIVISVMLAIVVIEAVILIPSYNNYKRDLLARLEHAGRAAITAAFALNGHYGTRDLISLGAMLTKGGVVSGGALYGPGGELMGAFAEAPDLTLAKAAEEGVSGA